MQLIVFVQPFLPGGTMSGFGVCQTVVDGIAGAGHHAAQALHGFENQHKNQHEQSHDNHYHSGDENKNNDDYQQYSQQDNQNNNQQHHVSHHAVMLESNQHAMMQHAAATPIPVQADHHSSHLSCGFCTLYGHAIPPPTLTPVWQHVLKRPFVTLAAFVRLPAEVILTDYIKPKSRAPPIII
jgi:hypothetical protein